MRKGKERKLRYSSQCINIRTDRHRDDESDKENSQSKLKKKLW